MSLDYLKTKFIKIKRHLQQFLHQKNAGSNPVDATLAFWRNGLRN